jgi:hypothetical protein
MAVCKRCASIDLDDAATRYTYLLGHVRVIISTAKAGCPGCHFVVKVGRRRGVNVGDKRNCYVILRRLGRRSSGVEVHFVELEGEDCEEGDEGSENEDTGDEESSEDNDESSEDSEESSEDNEESSDEEDHQSEDEGKSPIQLKLCSTYG